MTDTAERGTMACHASATGGAAEQPTEPCTGHRALLSGATSMAAAAKPMQRDGSVMAIIGNAASEDLLRQVPSVDDSTTALAHTVSVPIRAMRKHALACQVCHFDDLSWPRACCHVIDLLKNTCMQSRSYA